MKRGSLFFIVFWGRWGWGICWFRSNWVRSRKLKLTRSKDFLIFRRLVEEDWQIMEPFNEIPEIVITADTIIVLKMVQNKPKELSGFPIEAFNISGQ